jgi:hypothetical protein
MFQILVKYTMNPLAGRFPLFARNGYYKWSIESSTVLRRDLSNDGTRTMPVADCQKNGSLTTSQPLALVWQSISPAFNRIVQAESGQKKGCFDRTNYSNCMAVPDRHRSGLHSVHQMIVKCGQRLCPEPLFTPTLEKAQAIPSKRRALPKASAMTGGATG